MSKTEIRFLAIQIKLGKLTLGNIPTEYRSAVQAELERGNVN